MLIWFYQKCTETICETRSNLFICLNVLQFCAKVGKYSCRSINTSSRLDKLICFDRGWTCYILIMDAEGAPLTRNLCFGLHLQLHIQALFVVSDNKSGSKLHSELKQISTCGRHMPDECRIFSAREGEGGGWEKYDIFLGESIPCAFSSKCINSLVDCYVNEF